MVTSGMSGLFVQQQSLAPLEGAKKVAAILLALDREISQRILKHFDQNELRRIAHDAAYLGAISPPTLDALYDDLIDEISDGGVDLVCDAGRVEELITGVVPEEQVADIMSDVRGSSNQFVWRRVAGLPEKMLASYLEAEHPQTIAVVLSKVDSAHAAKVLAYLPGQTRSQTMRRMLLSKPIPDTVFRVLESTLLDDLFATSNAPSSAEINARVAGIINQLERGQVEEILNGITLSEPIVAAQLKNLLFSFEDIVKLSQRARTLIFDQLQTDRVILALQGAEAPLRDAVLPCLSARTRRMVEAELASPDMPSKKDIVAAQRQISDTVLRLAEQGVIEITPSEDASAP